MTLNSVALKEKSGVKFGKELRKEFLFDEKHLNLNHGESFSIIDGNLLIMYTSHNPSPITNHTNLSKPITCSLTLFYLQRLT